MVIQGFRYRFKNSRVYWICCGKVYYLIVVALVGVAVAVTLLALKRVVPAMVGPRVRAS